MSQAHCNFWKRLHVSYCFVSCTGTKEISLLGLSVASFATWSARDHYQIYQTWPGTRQKITLLFMKSATSGLNGLNESKLGRCVDQCTTNNWLHFQTDGPTHRPNSDIYSVTGNVSVMPFSASAELPNKVETWKLVQVCAISASECIRIGENGCLWEAGLSYRDTAARTGHAAMTVKCVWN